MNGKFNKKRTSNYQKWSKEKIIGQILALRKKGVDLGAANISARHRNLFTAASTERYFSCWGTAVKGAGINYDKIKRAGKLRRNEKLTKWPKERILKEIQDEKEPRNLLTAYRTRLPIYMAARRRFGSWEQALEAAGYGLKKGSIRNSNQIFRSKI